MFDPYTGTQKKKRTIAVQHSNEEMRDELYTIVDYGGVVLDVVVEHDVYGQITADLILKNRQDVDEFMTKINNSHAVPLKTLTNGKHFHTVEADSEQILDAIEQKLKLLGYVSP